MKQTPKQILQKHWGYSSFRPPQEEIIQSVLEGRDTLALLPTGGGKSICFQVPGMMMRGVCLVVTPLIALMKDQAEGLKRRGIPAEAVFSGMHPDDISRKLDNCLYGNVKFLYLSPERLRSDMMREYINRMEVNLLAVDEAHCISQWGYDFRPPYLEIAQIRPLVPGVPVIALTATATPEVITDIQEKLEFRAQNVFNKSFERKNLTYFVFQEENKLARLLRIIEKTPGTGIVYVRNRRQTKVIDDFLGKNGHSSTHYHAGIDASLRHHRQEEWIRGKVKVMVATNAFGMGIDKPDVRFVVHLDLPDSLEAYFQEAGRGGRDEKESVAVQLFEEADIRELERFLEASFPPVNEIRSVYRKLGNSFNLAVGAGRDAAFDFDLTAFCERYSLSKLLVHHSLRLLEREGYIMLSPFDETLSRIHIHIRPDDLYRFQVAQPAYDPFIKLLLRSYSGIMTDPVVISEKELARRAGVSEDRIIYALKYLQKMEVLRYYPRKTMPQIVFTTERMDEDQLIFSPAHYRIRKETARKRLDSVIDYVRSQTRCRSQMLLSYFGEERAPRCGKCDLCLARNKTGLNELEMDALVDMLKPVLKKEAKSLEELIRISGKTDEDEILRVIFWLRDAGKIKVNSNGEYRWI
jgi:ATP-dependent DNA helicase RecQ